VVGLVTPFSTMVTGALYATGIGELKATTWPDLVLKVTALPFNVPLVIVPASVSTGKVIVITVAVMRLQPSRLGTVVSMV
jgi:hypothetical protein